MWQLVLNDNAGLEGRGAVLWFPFVSLGKKVFWHVKWHVDSVYKTFIREIIMWYAVCSLAVIPRIAINGLVNVWLETGKSGLWDNWKDITCNVNSATEGWLLLFRDRGDTCCTQFWSKALHIDLLWPCLNIPWSVAQGIAACPTPYPSPLRRAIC